MMTRLDVGTKPTVTRPHGHPRGKEVVFFPAFQPLQERGLPMQVVVRVEEWIVSPAAQPTSLDARLRTGVSIPKASKAWPTSRMEAHGCWPHAFTSFYFVQPRQPDPIISVLAPFVKIDLQPPVLSALVLETSTFTARCTPCGHVLSRNVLYKS
eukprot:184264-Chlamydomonas_euryale.AAC.2